MQSKRYGDYSMSDCKNKNRIPERAVYKDVKQSGQRKVKYSFLFVGSHAKNTEGNRYRSALQDQKEDNDNTLNHHL
jgi:hypothetical protein